MAHLTLLTGLLEFKCDIVAVHDIEDLGQQPLVELGRMYFVETFAEWRLAFAPVPGLIDLVAELDGHIGPDVGNQRRHMIGHHPNPALALFERFDPPGHFAVLHIGDVGVEHDQPAFPGRSLGNLNPAAVGQQKHHAFRIRMAVFLQNQTAGHRLPLHV